MKSTSNLLAAMILIAVPNALWAQSSLNLDSYKTRFPTLSSQERATYEKAFAEQLKAAELARANQILGPVGGDVCTAPSPAPVNPFIASSTTIGATNNYDIATTCGVAQTLFAGTGASLDVAYGVKTDSNCSVTATLDPTGPNWDAAIFVLQANGAACTALPALADPQCITMDDDGASNATETVTWIATAGTEYYLIVDGFNAATGTFDLTITGTGCNLVPVELQRFSVD